MNPLSDLQTTVPGLLILVVLIAGSTFAMVKGLLTFDIWWAKMETLLTAAASGVLLGMNTKK